MFEKLNTAAPTVLLESFDANYDQSIETFKQIAELVSKEDKGRELVVQHNEKVEDLSKDIKLDKDVSTIAAVPTHDGLYVHASHSYVGQFLQKLVLMVLFSKIWRTTYRIYGCRLLKSRYRPICKLQSRTYIDYGR